MSKFFFLLHSNILFEACCGRKCSLFRKKPECCQPQIQNIQSALTSDNKLLAKLCLLLEAAFANHLKKRNVHNI